jgi:hypothetical protein
VLVRRDQFVGQWSCGRFGLEYRLVSSVVVMNVHVDVARAVMKVPLLRNTKRDHAIIAEDDFGVAYCAIPTPAALIPSRFLVDPSLDLGAVDNFGAFAKRFANRPYHFDLSHPHGKSVRGSCRRLATHEKQSHKD